MPLGCVLVYPIYTVLLRYYCLLVLPRGLTSLFEFAALSIGVAVWSTGGEVTSFGGGLRGRFSTAWLVATQGPSQQG